MISATRIAVGLDGSENSSRALAWAAREAAKRGCGLRVVHSFSVPYYGGEFGAVYPAIDIEELKTSHESIVQELLTGVVAAHPDLDIETVVKQGWAIGDLVKHGSDAEMVVVGSKGAGSLAGMLLGSVAHGVAHRSRRPVVLVPNQPVGAKVERIIVGADGSPAADAAIDWAVGEAELWGSELTVLHAWDYPYVGPRTSVVEPAELMELDADHLLLDSMSALRVRHPDTTVKIHARAVRNATVSALVDEAGESDLVVVGARGRGALKSVLLGSTSGAVIHRAHCPVAVVHAD